MNIKNYTHPDQLERYSFLWSEARLIIAAIALFLGGVPPITYFFPGAYGLTGSFLPPAWIISGIAAGYLLYRWHRAGQKLFSGKKNTDQYAFFVAMISGLNLGLAGLMGNNIGMSISSSRLIFIFVGLLYLAVAWHLWRRWNAHHQKIFS